MSPPTLERANKTTSAPADRLPDHQVAATLGRWFGANAATLNAVFPRLTNFSADVGFMA